MSEICNPKPMGDWIQEPDPKVCRPCALGPVVQWYRDTLKELAQAEYAAELEKLADETNVDDPQSVLTMCRELDKIKASVGDALRERLRDFDCSAQSYQPAAEEPNQQQVENSQ